MFLLIGMAAMFLVMLISGRVYGFSIGKIAAIALFLMPAGYFGAAGMFFIESGYWGGRSLYGAIFLVPLVMLPVSRILKVKYADLMDTCAPAGCVMFALLKVKCVMDNCCRGRSMTMGGKTFIFPSQKVECAVFLIIMLVLLWMVISKRFQGYVYPYFMLIYGTARFFLNLLRDTSPWIGPLPAGNFWSIIAVLSGIIAIASIKKKRNNQG